ncbi:MAG: nucleotidyltransferase substrate binding protein [Candidatus Margulisbacteria bacterium]|nr:nucleotidyltransferase substrate binding protein [Candidatus Margulisiibacteriota bacterium]
MLDLSSLEKALASLKTALDVACSNEQIKKMGEDIKDTIRAGVIQNFEFTYELCWKFMKRWLENNLGGMYVDGLNRRELFRLAAEHQLINNVETWMDYHDQRNETAHIYDKETAEEVFESAKSFLKEAEILLANLKKHNA